MKRWTIAMLIACSSSGCSGCRSSGALPSPPPGVTLSSLTVTSDSFPANGAIPVDFTCDGANKSPQLTFSAPPAGTKAFAIVADDPDAPGGTFTHWIVFNVPGDVRALPEAADPAAMGGAVGTNDFNRTGYAGPCPPRGEIHHYYFRVYGLTGAIDVPAGATRGAVDSAMSGRVLAEGALVGVFSH
jgi:Raf kinase inhibitor-like YbhB/YbcL family protein